MLFSCFVFCWVLVLFFSYGYHLLMVLLSLELILLGLGGYLILGSLGSGLFVGFMFLLVLVCMGGYGISLLVSVSRQSGGDWWSAGWVY